jgi:hypothetical protein
MAIRPFLLLACVASLFCGALSAQDLETPPEPIVIERQRALESRFNGAADLIEPSNAQQLTLVYALDQAGEMEIAGNATITDQVNCTAVISAQPTQGDSTLVVAVTPESAGPYSFTMNVPVNGGEYTYPVYGEMILHVDHHCHWWGCHDHDHNDDHHHCSTSTNPSWLLPGVLAVAAVTLIRRTRRHAA